MASKVFARITICILVIVGAVYSASAFAAEDNFVSFSAASCECAKKRSVAIDISAEGNGSLASAVFEISFDSKLLKFKKVSHDSDVLVEEKSDGDSVKICFLCKNGKQLGSNPVLFTVNFVSLDYGSCEIGLSVDGCADTNAEFVKVRSCTTGRVDVISRASGSENQSGGNTANGAAGQRLTTRGSNKSSSAGKSSGTSKSKRRDGSSSKANTSDEPSYVDFGRINDISPKEVSAVIPWVVACTASAVLLVVVFAAGKKYSDYKNNKVKKIDKPDE